MLYDIGSYADCVAACEAETSFFCRGADYFEHDDCFITVINTLQEPDISCSGSSFINRCLFSSADILTNIASASDADIITDFDTTTQLTISQTHLIHWRMAFELVQTQTSPFFVYIYGSENLCTHPNVLLGVFLVFDGSGDCTGDRTFEPCLFDQYNSGDHVSGVCVYRCQCATSCTDVLVNLQPVRSPTVHTISDISWQPV